MNAWYPPVGSRDDPMVSKSIPISVSEFQIIREENMYYVDKSLLIKDLLSRDDRGSYMFLRPRRFGKSMNLSMLDAFFNIKYKGNNWFDGLAISDHSEYDGFRNVFPVIRLDLKGIRVGTWEGFLCSMGSVIRDAYLSYGDLMGENVSKYSQDFYQRICNRDYGGGVLEYSLKALASMLRERYGRRVIVLIDEYDSPLTHSLGMSTNKRICEFLRCIYSGLLKGNRDVQMAYVTGITSIIFRDFFSGLNNTQVNNVFSTMSCERFGFTESEVRELLGYYEASDKFEEVREWYCGYRFGDSDMYNPVSIMNYIRRGFVPSEYWFDTCDDSVVGWMSERVDVRKVPEMSRLLIGGTVDLTISKYVDPSHMARFDDWRPFFELVDMGYLKVVPNGDGRYEMSIPNGEILRGVGYELHNIIGLSDYNTEVLVDSLTSMDDSTLMCSLYALLDEQCLFDPTDERHYAAVLTIAIRSLNREYRIIPEPDRIGCTVDIFLLPRTEGKEPIVIGIKCVDETDQMESAMEHVFDRIQRSKGYQGICGDVVMTGMVFCGKNSLVRSNRVHIDGRSLTKSVE